MSRAPGIDSWCNDVKKTLLGLAYGHQGQRRAVVSCVRCSVEAPRVRPTHHAPPITLATAASGLLISHLEHTIEGG